MDTVESNSSSEEWVPISLPIPSHWVYAEFERAFENISLNDLKIPQNDYLASGKFPVIDQGAKFIGGYTDDSDRVIRTDRAVIVFGDHTKCFKHVAFPFAPGADGIKVLKPRDPINEKFAYYACLSLRLPDRGYSRHYSFLKRSKFPLAPIAEQLRIVNKIEELFSELDKSIESLRSAREEIKIYRQAVLKYAFEGKFTARWRDENRERLETGDQLLDRIRQEREIHYRQRVDEWKSAIKDWEANGEEGTKPSKPRVPKPVTSLSKEVLAGLEVLPLGWVWDKLGWMTCGVEYGTAAKSSDAGQVPVVRMGNLQNAKIDWEDLVYSSDKAEIDQYSLQPGDVLFNRTNSPELVGKTAIYRGERPALFAGYLIRVNHIEAIVDSQYVNLFLNSHVARQHGNSVKTDGVNQSNINGAKLQNYPFAYCSLLEQREIVRVLDEKLSLVEQMQEEIETALPQAEALRHSILKMAFSGRLVGQNPTDEPAFVLLERIKTENSQQVMTNKNGKRKAAA
jgi:type I restriction enzyme, S subunit